MRCVFWFTRAFVFCSNYSARRVVNQLSNARATKLVMGIEQGAPFPTARASSLPMGPVLLVTPAEIRREFFSIKPSLAMEFVEKRIAGLLTE